MLWSLRPRWRDVAIAAAAILARLPFLLRADRFFDADEAVEGLMARHLGDHSLFLWGQRYKGTPEVFLTGAVFRVAGSGVIALKAVTLGCFVVFLCLNFRLVERLFSRRLAWMTTALFIAGPPSLALWTLSGSAEMVMTFLVGAVLLFAVSSRRWNVAAAALGAGFWIQQYIIYYVVSLVITAALTTPGWREIARDAVRTRVPRWLGAVTVLLLAAGTLYVVLGLIPFFMMQVHTTIAGLPIAVTHPQKMWWLAGALLASAALLAVVAIFRAQLIAPALAFIAGYMPAIVGRIGNHGLGAPISRLDAAGLRAALPDINGLMLPMLLGFRDPSTSRTVFMPPLVLAMGGVIALSYWSVWRRKQLPFFHVFPLVAAVMFLASGSYIDAQSYRYLMPIWVALPVVFAVGIDETWRARRAVGAVLLIFMIALFGTEQVSWFLHLQPDTETQQAIACLDANGIRAARAGYWLSYKIAFLTSERIIVSPTDGIDRYAPYAEATRDAPALAEICR